MAEICVYPSTLSLTRATAEHFIGRAVEAITRQGQFSVALSGGSTPKALYELLATDEFASQIDWSRTHVFWGDERCVPPDHLQSNYRLAYEALLQKVPIPAQNIHRVRTELKPEKAALDYEQTLRAFFAAQLNEPELAPVLARFDLVLLGLGEDGHTASLFPATTAVHEARRWVVAHYVDKLEAWRVTLTPIAINMARQVTFIVSGVAKAKALRHVLNGPFAPTSVPAQAIRPTAGQLLWLADAEAWGRPPEPTSNQ